MSRLPYILIVLLLFSCVSGKSLRRGDEAFADGDYAAALKHYEAAAEARPNSSEAAEKLERTRRKLAEQLVAVFTEGELPGLDRAGPAALPSMAAYAPGDPVFTSLVLFDRIRGTTFEQPIRGIIDAVPDVRLMLEGTGVDPVRDFDSLFVATARPRVMDETFLVARHVLEPDMLKTKLDRRFDPPPEWTGSSDGLFRALVPTDAPMSDVRKIMLQPDPIALVVRPEWVEQLTTELPADSPLMAGVSGTGLPRPSMLNAVTYVHRAATDPSTILLASARARFGFARFVFESVRMRLSDVERPLLEVDLELRTPDDAMKLASSCPSIKTRAIANVNFLARGLVRVALDPLTCEASGKHVAVSGVYTPEVMLRLLAFVPAMILRPPGLNRLPPPSPR